MFDDTRELLNELAVEKLELKEKINEQAKRIEELERKLESIRGIILDNSSYDEFDDSEAHERYLEILPLNRLEVTRIYDITK